MSIFLGKVIRLTEGHRAVVEDKPEVKKAGGVKYTPVFIVRKTFGPTLKGKTPLEVVKITVRLLIKRLENSIFQVLAAPSPNATVCYYQTF